MREAPDPYTHGMVHWNAEDDRVLNRYRRWQLALVRPWLGSRILEIGAGHGNFAALVLEQGACERYTALEPSPHFSRALQELAGRTPGLEHRQAPLTELTGADLGAFDTVLSIHVLEHIEDDLGFLTSALQAVRPGGHVITLVPALPALYATLDRQIGHFRRYTQQMAADLARRAGAELLLNRYDNLAGVLGWWWACKIRGLDYRTGPRKAALIRYFEVFSKFVLPVASRVERRFPPPVGLNLTFVLRRPVA
jgi:2-polyprenyl-3-methyl-5-hydroxy-6-metoxy-1,4-benzoquinol methylase